MPMRCIRKTGFGYTLSSTSANTHHTRKGAIGSLRGRERTMRSLHNYDWLIDQLIQLEQDGFDIDAAESLRWVIVKNLSLSGARWSWNHKALRGISVKIDLPVDFPMTCPGTGAAHPNEAIHIPRGIQWNHLPLTHMHACPHRPWAWVCFLRIAWDPYEDDLISLVGLIEQSLYKRRQTGGTR